MARATTGSLHLLSSPFPPPPHRSPPLLTAGVRLRRRRRASSLVIAAMADAAAAPSPPSSSSAALPHSTLETLGGGKDSILPALKSLERPFKAFPVVGWSRHIETIFAAYFRSAPAVDFRYRRVCLRAPDDGAVAIDWAAGDDARLPADTPVLILMHGLSGGSGDSYVKHMFAEARRNGWRAVAYNGRGGGDSPVTTPQFYSASYTEDIRMVVKHVKTLYPSANVYAVGWSLGGNILVRYLGEESQNCPLSGAVSLCNPFNLVMADEDIRKGLNNIYDRAIANSLSKIFQKNRLLFEGIGGEYNIDLADNGKTIRDYDEAITRVTFGFKSVDEYYSKSCSSDSIKHVRIPLLCIQHKCFLKYGFNGRRDVKPMYSANKAYVWVDRKMEDLVGQINRLDSMACSPPSSLPWKVFVNTQAFTRSIELPSMEYKFPTCTAENDPVAPSRAIPREDIKANPSCLLIVTPNGGHLGWVAGDDAPFGAPWTDRVAMEFLNHVEKGRREN
ncbi:hypothetical protein Sjap_005647 [Stephania japonica]|uniref:AB hydrolase-1 domain-containing protein n=1 Tax=Stephania japonica TaxID=461633 RepID=A0AAP0K645_9MAGN